MKRALLMFAGVMGLASIATANVQIEIDAGVLANATGTTLTNGSLLQLVAVRSGASGTFAAPTTTSFTGGSSDEIVVASFGFTQGKSGFVTGETDSNAIFNLENTSSTTSTSMFDVGDALMLRWYPSLTYSSATNYTTAAPGTVNYGQYRSNSGEGGGIAWFAPGDGTQLTIPNGLNFLTVTAGGSNNDMLGRSSLTTAVVPEPSTYGIVGGILMSLVCFRAWKHRSVKQIA